MSALMAGDTRKRQSRVAIILFAMIVKACT